VSAAENKLNLVPGSQRQMRIHDSLHLELLRARQKQVVGQRSDEQNPIPDKSDYNQARISVEE
jgi:hypothetical protein